MTTYAQMLELADPPDAFVRGHGWGSVRILMAGSLNANPSCWVRLYGSGKMLWVDQSDLRLSHNPGDERDGIEIPEDWTPEPVMTQEERLAHASAIHALGVEPHATSERVINILWNEWGVMYEASTDTDGRVTFAPKPQ